MSPSQNPHLKSLHKNIFEGLPKKSVIQARGTLRCLGALGPGLRRGCPRGAAGGRWDTGGGSWGWTAGLRAAAAPMQGSTQMQLQAEGDWDPGRSAQAGC